MPVPPQGGLAAKDLWVFFHGSGRNLSGSYPVYAWVTAHGRFPSNRDRLLAFVDSQTSPLADQAGE